MVWMRDLPQCSRIASPAISSVDDIPLASPRPRRGRAVVFLPHTHGGSVRHLRSCRMIEEGKIRICRPPPLPSYAEPEAGRS